MNPLNPLKKKSSGQRAQDLGKCSYDLRVEARQCFQHPAFLPTLCVGLLNSHPLLSEVVSPES